MLPNVKLIQAGIIAAAVVAILATVYLRGRHDVQALRDAERVSTALVVAKVMASNKAREVQLLAAVDAARTDMWPRECPGQPDVPMYSVET